MHGCDDRDAASVAPGAEAAGAPPARRSGCSPGFDLARTPPHGTFLGEVTPARGVPGVRPADPGRRPSRRTSCSAVAAVFAVNGFIIASLFSRLPAVRSDLGVTKEHLGMLLLASSAGSLIALPFASVVVRRFRPSGAVSAGAAAVCGGVGVIATFPSSVPAFVAGLFAFGAGSGAWDVAMNVEAAAVERRLVRILMPRFHAAFSLGAALGCGVAVAMAAAGVRPGVHLLFAALLVGVVIWAGAQQFHSDGGRAAAARGPRAWTRTSAWREGRVLLLGALALCLAFGEGTAGDWIAIAVRDGFHGSETEGALTLAGFALAMTGARLGGPPVIERFGRVTTLRGCALFMVAGVLVFVAGAGVPSSEDPGVLGLALAGAVLWGIGASLGVPVVMSAAGDDDARAAERVGVVATISYTALLGGPPLIGFLADRVSITGALLTVPAIAALALGVAGAVRQVRPAG